MKIKELNYKDPINFKVKTPKGVIGYWKSQWAKGVWLTETPTSTRIYPQFVDNIKDCLEWELADSEEECNCHIRLRTEFIDNTTDGK